MGTEKTPEISQGDRAGSNCYMTKLSVVKEGLCSP